MNSETSAAFDRCLAFVDGERNRLGMEDEMELVKELAAFFDEEHCTMSDDDGEEE